jgi:hypothetical protein
MQQRTAQQQAFLQQQQQRQMLAQQQQQGAMGMGYPNGMNPQLTPQQVAAIQAQAQAGNMGGQFPIPLPQHMRQQLQQQHQQQAAHNPQAAQAAMAHAQAQAQAIQHQNQQQQAQAQAHAQQNMQAHAIAMQHAASQSSNPSQSGNQGPSTQPPQGPMRPPSAMGGPHQGQASPAPQPTPQQGPQQQGPQQPQQQPQQQQPQQQTPAQPQAQNVPQQAPQPPQNAQIQQRAGQMNPNARMAAMMGRTQVPATGLSPLLKLMTFADQLGRFDTEREVNSIQTWQAFVARFFTPEASFMYSVFHKPDQTSKQFEIVYAALPRYFYRLFECKVSQVQLTLDGANEKAIMNEGAQPMSVIFSERSKFIHWFEDKSHVVCSGKVTAIVQGERISSLTFDMTDHEHYLSRTQLESLFIQPSPSQLSQTQSPRMTNKSKQRAQQRLVKQESLEPTLNLSGLPPTPITDWGIPGPMLRFLEVSETMINMQDLMAFYKENSAAHPNLYPAEAMKSWVAQQISSNPGLAQGGPNQQGQTPQMLQQQGLQQGQNIPPGIRTPSGTGQPGAANHQFMSPAMANLALPNAMNGSPHLMQQNHTPSPAGGHPMGAQHSQQGTNSNPSANTSPNVTNKRRRSTVKVDEDGGADVNGAPTGKVKQSPRVGGNKRVKPS